MSLAIAAVKMNWPVTSVISAKRTYTKGKPPGFPGGFFLRVGWIGTNEKRCVIHFGAPPGFKINGSMGSNKGKKTFMGANFVIAVCQFFNRQNLNEIDFCNGFRFEITGQFY